MDSGTLGAISTVLVAIAFAGVCWWAFSPRRKKRFDDAANLPFADEDRKENEADSSGEQKQAGEADDRAEHHSGDEADRRN
ncbi:cbb3-type cytochrome oxidase subunit 3 [Marinimicrobium sp. C2-29]|uniref:cbb3-type cytochrome oxidase subunit 3 n=1 Tax=Marinimicrobium sp. C2-29 TaxID=3139825 RepID=UPI00313872E7